MEHRVVMGVKDSFVGQFARITNMHADSTKTAKWTKKSETNADGAG